MNSTDEFLKAFASLEVVVEEPIEYRIHYDDHGNIVQCTMNNHPNNSQYIVVNKDEYYNYFRYTVVNNKLKLIDTNPGYRVQLKKSDSGYTVVKDHAGIILELDESYSNIEYYDATN